MPYTIQPASEYTTAELADLFNRSFEDYFMPINFTGEQFELFTKRDGINLSLSRVLLNDDQPIGLGLISSRDDVSRLGAMGIVKDWRSRGAGTWLVEQLMDEARGRNEKQMLLEVIVQNEPAVHIYKKFGFKTIRQLFGFVAKEPAGKLEGELGACKIDLVIEKAEQFSLPNLPWQADVEALRRVAGSSFGYYLNGSYVAITNHENEHIAIRILVSKNAFQGGEEHLLNTLFATFPGKTWHVPAVFPEEQAPIFENVGMTREEISQWQMVADL
jgi:ribosomal protein S18 acetylase RimI-like enzyme